VYLILDNKVSKWLHLSATGSKPGMSQDLLERDPLGWVNKDSSKEILCLH